MRPDFKHVSYAIFCLFAIKLLIAPDISFSAVCAELIAALVIIFFEYKSSLLQIKHQNEKLEALTKRLEKAEEISGGLKGEIISIRNAQGIKGLNIQAGR